MIEHKPDTPDKSPPTEAIKNDPLWVPWSPQQTFHGVLWTLIPWVSIALLQNLLGGNAPLSQPLPLGEDIAGAIIIVILTVAVEGAFLIAPIYYANKVLRDVVRRRHAIAEALGLRGFRVGPALLWCLGLLAIVIAANWLYSLALTALQLNVQTNSDVLLQESVTQPITVYGLLLGSVFVAPFCEEIFFRGFVFSGLLRELSPIWAMLVSAALFAIAHTDPGSFIPLFIIGICLAFLRWRTGSTWVGMILHVMNNLLGSADIILAIHHIYLPF